MSTRTSNLTVSILVMLLMTFVYSCKNGKHEHGHGDHDHSHSTENPHAGHDHGSEDSHAGHDHGSEDSHAGHDHGSENPHAGHDHGSENPHGAHGGEKKVSEITDDNLSYSKEKHFKNVRQLTFGGDNAEAYWSFDDKSLVFQSTNPAWGVECDQIYIMDPFTAKKKEDKAKIVSTGKGRTTCSYYMPGNQSIIYSSTHKGDAGCPHVPERTGGKYTWPIYSDFEIYTADLDGNLLNQLTDSPGYDAEPTVSPKGDLIVFTSIRTGDLELYTMKLDGSDVKQVTTGLGYDGGAFFSPDGTKLIFRSSRPKTEEAIKEYNDLLKQGLVQPTEMELYVCNVDGSDLKKITDLGNANWAPFFHPSGEKVIFSSNHNSKRGFPFNLFMVNLDGTGLEQITFDDTFDSFPMFSYDGKHLVFASNRNNGGTRDTNLFLAEWVD